MYWWISMLSLGCKNLCIIVSFLVLLSICWSSSKVYFKNGSKYLIRSIAQLFIPLMRFLLQSLVLRRFLVCLRYSFFIFSFMSTCLMVSTSNKCSDPFLIWQFYFFYHLSFSASHYEHWTFFYAKFHSYILTEYSYYLCKSLQFFFMFCKQCDIVHVH